MDRGWACGRLHMPVSRKQMDDKTSKSGMRVRERGKGELKGLYCKEDKKGKYIFTGNRRSYNYLFEFKKGSDFKLCFVVTSSVFKVIMFSPVRMCASLCCLLIEYLVKNLFNLYGIYRK